MKKTIYTVLALVFAITAFGVPMGQANTIVPGAVAKSLSECVPVTVPPAPDPMQLVININYTHEGQVLEPGGEYLLCPNGELIGPIR